MPSSASVAAPDRAPTPLERQSVMRTLRTPRWLRTEVLAGLVVALAGVILARVLDMPALDGWSSIGIGLILIGMAAFLMIETHGLLIGEAADPELVAAIRAVVRDEPGVHHVNTVLTQHLGPSDVLVNVSLDMDDALSAGAIEAMVSRVEARLKARSPDVTRVFIEVQARATPAPDALGAAPASANA